MSQSFQSVRDTGIYVAGAIGEIAGSIYSNVSASFIGAKKSEDGETLTQATEVNKEEVPLSECQPVHFAATQIWGTDATRLTVAFPDAPVGRSQVDFEKAVMERIRHEIYNTPVEETPGSYLGYRLERHGDHTDVPATVHTACRLECTNLQRGYGLELPPSAAATFRPHLEAKKEEDDESREKCYCPSCSEAGDQPIWGNRITTEEFNGLLASLGVREEF